MRPLLTVAAIALLLPLAACGDSTPPPATSTTPAATTPAAPPALELGPLIGDWAATPENCGTPISIAAGSFRGYENSCEIGGWTDNGDGTFTAALSCTAEGQTANEKITMTPIFGPQGEGIRLAYDDRGGSPVTVFRCRAPRAE